MLTPRFARVIWTPGNHDLWCPPGATDRTRGQARYDELVAHLPAFGVLTPEDPYVEWPGDPDTFIVPMFLLFDYTFRPPDMSAADARRLGARERRRLRRRADARSRRRGRVVRRLVPRALRLRPRRGSRRAARGRRARCSSTTGRCATTWRARRAFRGSRSGAARRAPKTGHAAFARAPSSPAICTCERRSWRHGVRYEEVSLGYPRDWRPERGIDWYLREIFPNRRVDRRFVPDAIRSSGVRQSDFLKFEV